MVSKADSQNLAHCLPAKTPQEKSAHFFETILSHISDAVMLTDAAGDFKYVCSNVENIFGYTPDKVAGMGNVAGLLGKDFTPSALDIKLDELQHVEHAVPDRQGRIRNLLLLLKGVDIDGYAALYVCRDNTDAKLLQDLKVHQELWIDLLKCINTADDLRALLQRLTALFQNRTGFEAVGVRIKEGPDYPYYETQGFPADFVAAENRLCVFDPLGKLLVDKSGNPILECMCGNILQGRFDPEKPFFTAKGGFWTNSTTELLGTTSEKDRLARTRNRCHGEGFESVGLFPLRVGAKTIGLLQLNDRRKGCFNGRLIELIESMTDYIAVAVDQKLTQKALRQKETDLEIAQRIAQLGSFRWDFKSGAVDCSPELLRIHRVEPADFGGRKLSSLNRNIHPDDAEKVNQANQVAMAEGITASLEYRILLPDGGIRHVMARGDVICDAQGRPVAMHGTAQDITRLKEKERALDEREEQLRIKTGELEEMNAALRVLLKKRDEDLAESEKNMLFNVQELVIPYLKKLEAGGLSPYQRSNLKILSQNIENIVSPFARTLSHLNHQLTPTLIQTAHMIRQGMTTAEIAEHLGLSTKSVESYRKRIRERLGIQNKKINLRSYLLSLT